MTGNKSSSQCNPHSLPCALSFGDVRVRSYSSLRHDSVTVVLTNPGITACGTLRHGGNMMARANERRGGY